MRIVGITTDGSGMTRLKHAFEQLEGDHSLHMNVIPKKGLPESVAIDEIDLEPTGLEIVPSPREDQQKMIDLLRQLRDLGLQMELQVSLRLTEHDLEFLINFLSYNLGRSGFLKQPSSNAA